MNIYTSTYDILVASRKHLKEQWKPVKSGLECHHIVPKHAGGTDEESNFTYLTRREHIIAHWLLWKVYRHIGDKRAFLMMQTKGDIPSQTGVKQHISHRKKISKSLREYYKANPRKCGWKRSEETRRKISEGHKGIKIRRKKVTCPHCEKVGDVSLMHRYHFENCKARSNT